MVSTCSVVRDVAASVRFWTIGRAVLAQEVTVAGAGVVVGFAISTSRSKKLPGRAFGERVGERAHRDRDHVVGAVAARVDRGHGDGVVARLQRDVA